ncbi:MAG: hypothetical protein ABIP06_11915 [Pyrinomonadaceae bacterium]
MATLSLSLRIYIVGGTEIGTMLGVRARIFNVQGGKVQPLEHGAYIGNDMLVADELKEAIYRQNLLVIRDSDSLSIELYQAYQKRTKLLVLPSVFSTEGNGMMRGAHLSLRNATIKKFKIGKSDSVNQDVILFGFSSRNAEIYYGNNSAEIFRREVMRIASAVATSVEGIGKNF